MTALEAPAALKDRLRANFRDYIPALGGLEWEAEKVGLLTFASDGEPILGPVSRLPGLFVGVAFHSGGFAYNPASGLLLAEFVADGKTQNDLAAFSPDRFTDDETAGYLAETVKQRDVVRRRH
jgi:sarcosine oxidase, subunit beta